MIHINPKHKGLLHKDLGVKQGHHIPEKKLESAEHSKNPAVRKRAVFAENAKHWHHGDGHAHHGHGDGHHSSHHSTHIHLHLGGKKKGFKI